jgi:hypothetical protein
MLRSMFILLVAALALPAAGAGLNTSVSGDELRVPS